MAKKKSVFGKSAKSVVAKKTDRKNKPTKKNSKKKATVEKPVVADIYEYSDEEVENTIAKLNKSEEVDGVYEYEQPEHFDDNDSEIDEDEAFDSEDEETFGSFFSKNKAAEISTPQDVSSGEEEEQDSDEGGGDLLSDLLNGSEPARKLSVSNEEEVQEGPADLSLLVEGLVDSSSSIGKNSSGKKNQEEERTEQQPESEFAHSSSTQSQELTLESLLGVASGSSSSTKEDKALAPPSKEDAMLKKQLIALKKDDAALVAPLDYVHEERANRKVAYEKKKKDVGIFQTVVKANREGETIDFTKQLPPRQNLSSAALSTKFEASTDMEKDVEKLLQQSGLSNRGVVSNEADELKEKQVSKEEVLKRQQELSKMRSLMFYEEKKAKRVKKIKSKLYHKIRNKQKEKLDDKERTRLREINPDLADELDMKDAEKRAEERMTLKHNNTSKWVKHQLARGNHADDNTRQAIADQLQRGQKLRRKIETTKGDDSSDDEDSESEHLDENEVDRLQRKLQNKANALLIDIEDDENGTAKKKGIYGMKFMQRAMEKQREKAKTEAETLLKELEMDGGELPDSDIEPEQQDVPKKKKKLTKEQKKKELLELSKKLPSDQLKVLETSHKASVSGSISVNLDGSTAENVVKEVLHEFDDPSGKAILNSKADCDENPWLIGNSNKSRNKRKLDSAVDPKEVQVDVKKAVRDAAAGSSMKKAKKNGQTEEIAFDKSQEELVAEAFDFACAEDDEDEIQKEKDEIVEDDTELKHGKDVAKMLGMNGWGSWAGEGIKPTKRQKDRKRKADEFVASAKEKALQQRKDFKMKRVIINEKKDKKLSKYTCSSVPYPFTSRQQYELAMRNPIGRDWNTVQSARSFSKPKVITKIGTIIEPLKLTKDQKNAKEKPKPVSKSKKKSNSRKAKF